MSYGLFEHLAYNEQAHRVEQRKALALARVRATQRFARFVQAGDTEERLALVAGDLQDTVKQACAEMEYPHWEHIHEAVVAHLGGADGLLIKEAIRKPKMCPYHREVTDISLAAGDPASGFSAMAQHAWGANHCQGEWEGKCNFKADMTTQDWWDKKAEQAEERRQERERQQEQPEQNPAQTDVPTVPEPEFDGDESVEPIPAEAQGDSVFREENADIHTDVHNERALEPAMAARQAAIRCPECVGRYPGREPNPNCPTCQGSGVVDTIYRRDSDPYVNQKYDWRDRYNQPVDRRRMDASHHEAEALKTVDVERSEGPVPKMDKSTWTPENVTFIDAEMPGSPHPTRHQDIKEPVDYEADFEEQTRAVTESQDVTQEGGVGRQTEQGGTFPRGDQAPPVTSATDPDKNPLKDDDDEEEEE